MRYLGAGYIGIRVRSIDALLASEPQVYPTRFYVTYPLAFFGGLAGMYALRSEVTLAGTQLLAAVAVGAVGIFAGWDIARGSQKLAAGEEATNLRISGLMMAALVLPFVFLIRDRVGSSTGLWFCALGFACVPIGFVAAVLQHRRKARLA